MVVRILRLLCVPLKYVLGSAKTLTSPTSSSAFYWVLLPCPQGFSILNYKTNRSKKSRAEKNIKNRKKETSIVPFLSVVVNNFYYDSKLSSTTMKALKNSYRTRSNFDFPHHLQWESSAPQLSYDTNGTAAQKGSSPSFWLRKTDCRTGNEHGHKSKKKKLGSAIQPQCTARLKGFCSYQD